MTRDWKDCESTTPKTAIATRPATRDTALLIPDATPECALSTAFISVVVSGATVIAIPRAITPIAGMSVVQSERPRAPPANATSCTILVPSVISTRAHLEVSGVTPAGTTVRLNQHLHFASNNHVPISTPQMFLGERRICEEDTDLGLKYTLAQLAPAVLK